MMQRGAGSLALPLYTEDIRSPAHTSWVGSDSAAEAGGHLPQGQHPSIHSAEQRQDN